VIATRGRCSRSSHRCRWSQRLSSAVGPGGPRCSRCSWVVAIAAELAGIYVGAFSALIGTAGVALIVGRSGSGEEPKNGVELGAMAALLLVAVLFGTDQPPGD
jgi:hypothetical protein